MMATPRVIDSHLHVWANQEDSKQRFPYEHSPPVESLRNVATAERLIDQMDANGVDGALIVQPIHHGFDHSYVKHAMDQYPNRFKGMLLHEPGTSVEHLEQIVLSGNFQGVRFNPYLWGKQPGSETLWNSMCSDMEVYKRCGTLKLPVGIMCFQGLHLHYKDILQFLDESPETICILDHFGFASDEENFQKLLSLADHPSVHVKISALFRLGDSPPYETVREKRFIPILEAFTSERLMFGSDFPFCLEHPNAYNFHSLIRTWCPTQSDCDNILYKTSERLFGPWSDS